MDPSRMEPDDARAEPRRLDERDAVDESDRFVVREEVAISLGEARRTDRRAGWANRNWGYLLAFGVAAVIFGAVALASAFDTLSALVWLTGLYLVFMGIVQLLTLGRGGSRGIRLVGAAVAVVGGVVLLVWPGETLTVLAVVGGITFLASGVVDIVSALRGPREDRLTGLTRGAGLAVLGALMMVWPGPTITVLGVVLGLIAIVWGASLIVDAFALRRAGRAWEELREQRSGRQRSAA